MATSSEKTGNQNTLRDLSNQPLLLIRLELDSMVLAFSLTNTEVDGSVCLGITDLQLLTLDCAKNIVTLKGTKSGHLYL